MSIFKKLFSKEGPRLDLRKLIARFQEVAKRLEGSPVHTALLIARVGDGYRDMDRDPMPHATFEAAAKTLDEESQRRLALLASALEDQAIKPLLAAVMPADTPQRSGVQAQVTSLIELAKQRRLLTLELLNKSELRMEELARAFADALGLKIKGETPEASKEALERLNYEHLLQQAEEAKKAADERMEKFKKRLEEQQDASAPFRRGKW